MGPDAAAAARGQPPGLHPGRPSPRARRAATTCRRAHGAALFVDISGFTPLTEALARELGGRRGAEELSATLDRIFAALMEPLHAWHGSVVYFSGDAVTAWIDGDDGSRATACGLAMQEVMDRVGVVTDPGGADVALGGQGRRGRRASVHRFVVGDPRVQLIDVLAGQLMDSLAAAEQQSRAGRRRPRRRRPGVARRPGDAPRDPRRGARDGGRRRRPCVDAPPAPSPGRTGRSFPRRSPASGCCRRCGSGWSPAAASSSPTSARRCRSSCGSVASTSRAIPRRRGCSTTSSRAPSARSTSRAAGCSS